MAEELDLVCPICNKGTAIHFGVNKAGEDIYRCVHNQWCGQLFKALAVEGKLILTTEVPRLSSISAPREHGPATVNIKCENCNAIRVVKAQDAFQVKRCVTCQMAYRAKSRSKNGRRATETIG